MNSSFLTATARTLAALFFSLILIACDPPPGDRHYVTADVLNVRNIPQTGKVVAQLRHGDSVYIVEIKNGWGRLSDKSAWVSLQHLSTSRPSPRPAKDQLPGSASGVIYTIVDEEGSFDAPFKSQIKQTILASGVPTKAELEAELLKRYGVAKARRDFQYHNNLATDIYIYIYGTEEQVRAGGHRWIGMVWKRLDDKGPSITIDDEKLAALSQTPEERFGLSEQERKQAFLDMSEADYRARREAKESIPDSQIIKQIHLQSELANTYRAKIAQKSGLTKDQLLMIIMEGVKKGWP